MLQSLREKIVGWALWVLIGVIVVPFAFFGIETFRTGGADPQVAKVGSQRITESQLSRAYEQRLQQLQQLMGDKYNPADFDQVRFREAVLRDLVQESLMRQHVSEAGYRASDAAVRESLQDVPAFQDEGRFSNDLYRARLANLGYTTERFEGMTRDSLAADQLRDSLVLTAFQTPKATDDAARLALQKRQVAWAVLAPERFRAQAVVTDAQVKARYEERKSTDLSPERVRLNYLELSLEALPKTAAPGVEVLKAVYETEKAGRYTRPEEREARHILIPFGADKAAARAQAENLLGKLRAGGDFAALAAASSADPGSKSNGGSLGWIKRGQMTPRFEQALFDLKKGVVSDPVETEFGWHLIRVDGVREAQVRRFEDAEVQKELIASYSARETEKRFQELSEKLEQIAFESPGSLEPAAKALTVAIQTSDWLTRKGGEGVWASPKLVEAAFSEDVIKNGENSRPITVAPGRVWVVRKQSYEPARVRPFDEVAERIRGELRDEAARATAASHAAALYEAARKGEELSVQAQVQGAEYKRPDWMSRQQPEVAAEILKAAFALPRPAAGKTSVGQATLASGALAVVAVTGVQDAVPSPNDADARRETARVREALAGAEFAAYRAHIESQIKVKISERPAEDKPAP